MVTTLIQSVNLNILTGVQEITKPTNFPKDSEQNNLEQRVSWPISKASPFLLKVSTNNFPTATDISSYCTISTCSFPVRIHFMNGLAQ
jgi:hypothetical protein